MSDNRQLKNPETRPSSDRNAIWRSPVLPYLLLLILWLPRPAGARDERQLRLRSHPFAPATLASAAQSPEGQIPLRVMLVIPDAVRGYKVREGFVNIDFGGRLAKQAEKNFQETFTSVQVVAEAPANDHPPVGIDLIVSLESPHGWDKFSGMSGTETLTVVFVARRPNREEIFRVQESDSEDGNRARYQDREGAAVSRKCIQDMLLNDSVRAMLGRPPVAATPAAPTTRAAVGTTPPEPKPAVPAPPPTIALSAPAGVVANQVLEIKESPVVIRGVAMDSSGIPDVAVNGAPANMRPQNAQAAEFWTEPLALQPGDNRIQITASNAAHIETKLVFTAHYTPKPPLDPRALSKPQIIELLQGGVSCSHIASLVKARGIKFTPSPDDLADLRAAGSDDELLKAIEQAAK